MALIYQKIIGLTRLQNLDVTRVEKISFFKDLLHSRVVAARQQAANNQFYVSKET